MMNDIKVVLFDLGGTLVYFDSDWSATLRQAGAAMAERLYSLGFQVDTAAFAETFTVRMEGYRGERDMDGIEDTTAVILAQELTQSGYPDAPDAMLREALRTFYAVTQPHWQVEADALDTLHTLRAAGYRLGILSNAADDEDVRVLVNQSGFAPFMERVFTSAEVGMRKPHRRIFDRALDGFAIAPHQVVMVGDKLEADVRGAQEVGMAGIWLPRRAPAGSYQLLSEIRPDAIAGALTCLPSILNRWQMIKK